MTPIFSSLKKLPVPPHAAGVVATLLDLKDGILFLQNVCVPFLFYVMCLTSLTDSFDDRRSQCSLI